MSHTPDPRGFPRQSPEARLREMLPTKREDHWSFDTKCEQRQKESNRCLQKLVDALRKAEEKSRHTGR